MALKEKDKNTCKLLIELNFMFYSGAAAVVDCQGMCCLNRERGNVR